MGGNNQELLPSTLHVDKNSSDVKSELCVPDDNLADIELFPNFSDNWISLTGLLPTSEYDPLFSFDKTDDLWSFDEVDGEDLWNFSQDTLEGKAHISLSPLPEQKIERKDSLTFSSIEQEIGGTSSGEMIVSSTKHNIEQEIGGTSSSEMNMIVRSIKHHKKRKVYNNDIGGSKKSRNKHKVSKNAIGGSKKSRFRRRCSHCEAEKTPQWRMGPDGPNTLCNACGVRYKQGRLVSDYRPAASPTFDTRKHSNFHRKILKKKKKIYEDEYDAGEVLDA